MATGMVLLGMLLPLSFNKPVFASPPLDPTSIRVEISPEPTPVLPPGVIEIIRFNFKDKGERVIQEAIKVASCESSLGTTAVNTKNKNMTRDDGIFQVNSIHQVPVKFLHNPRVNIAVARQLYDEWKGWGAWYSSRSCHHLK